jgi:DNA-binding GntR family transcriptional regulator
VTTPKHARLTETLRERINQGSYDAHEGKLPSEAELSVEFGVSRTTVRSALATLLYQGLIRSESGVGYFVRRLHRYAFRPQEDLGRAREGPEQDWFLESTEHLKPSQTIEVSYVPAPRYVARRLDIGEGDFVGTRKRLRAFDGVPYQINDSYYPRDIVDGTDVMAPADIARGVNTVLAERGHQQVRAVDEIYIRMPEPDELERLDILPGTPVAVHVITGFDAADRPVRVVRNVLPGDRHVIMFERTHPDLDAAGPRR